VARTDAARVEVERQEAAKKATDRQLAALQEAAPTETARLAALKAEDDEREEKLRAIGRQLPRWSG